MTVHRYFMSIRVTAANCFLGVKYTWQIGESIPEIVHEMGNGDSVLREIFQKVRFAS